LEPKELVWWLQCRSLLLVASPVTPKDGFKGPILGGGKREEREGREKKRKEKRGRNGGEKTLPPVINF